MRTIAFVPCTPGGLLQLIDPTSFYEPEFEKEVVQAFACCMPEYHCGVFAGSFRFENSVHTADLALLHRTNSHWFVVEVELLSHSLTRHVLPQIRSFRYGTPEPSCVESLLRAFPHLDRESARQILDVVPRGVAVVSNAWDDRWEASLHATDAQYLSVAVFRDGSGRVAHGLSGRLEVAAELLGYAQYSASDRSLRIRADCGLPLGVVQILDQRGIPSLWETVLSEDRAMMWIRKQHGVPSLDHGEHVRLLRSSDRQFFLSVSPKY